MFAHRLLCCFIASLLCFLASHMLSFPAFSHIVFQYTSVKCTAGLSVECISCQLDSNVECIDVGLTSALTSFSSIAGQVLEMMPATFVWGKFRDGVSSPDMLWGAVLAWLQAD